MANYRFHCINCCTRKFRRTPGALPGAMVLGVCVDCGDYARGHNLLSIPQHEQQLPAWPDIDDDPTDPLP